MEGQQSLSGNIRVGVPRLHACPMARQWARKIVSCPVSSSQRRPRRHLVPPPMTATSSATPHRAPTVHSPPVHTPLRPPSPPPSPLPSPRLQRTSQSPTAPSATSAIAQGSLAAEGTANIAVEAFNPARPHRRIFRSSCAGSSQVKAQTVLPAHTRSTRPQKTGPQGYIWMVCMTSSNSDTCSSCAGPNSFSRLFLLPHPPSATSSGRPSPLDAPVPQGAFPGVSLLVGVNSDEQCAVYNSLATMSHVER
ncbi:hypothetical protein AcV5_010150 [Taiwanofungus camphoratus]|nr:hypothetical protein AcV5_010150 [Antrodia cinnamomea]